MMIANPHDALVKVVLSHPEHARGALRAIVPAQVAEALDWSTLVLRPGSFVDSALNHQHTDLLYSLTSCDGEETLVYLLFEHQSTPPTDGLMAHRLLRYQVEIWNRWRESHRRAKTLPMIVPIVMYHGAASWAEPRSFDALLAVPARARPAVDPYLVRFTYLLYDLSAISDDELREGAMTALAKLVMMCFKHARGRADFAQILTRWMTVVRDVTSAPNGLEALAQVIRYILQVNEHVGAEALQEILEREIGPEARDTVMTTGQQLINQGHVQGMRQGIQQGRHQALQDMLLRLLRQRFGEQVDRQTEERIASAPVEQIETWAMRVLTAATLAELMAD